jgi:DNA-binding CsgD family transcriptional regulator
MTALAQSDLLAALGFLREAQTITGPEPFPPELLEQLRLLIPCEAVHFSELDLVHRRVIDDVYNTGEHEHDDPLSEGQRLFWRLRDQHPIGAYLDRTGDCSAKKLSDFVTRRELRRLEVFEWYQRGREPFEITFALRSPPWHAKRFLLHRERRDFSERDRALLDLLSPHLAHLDANANTRSLAAALAVGAQAEGELIVLDAADAIEFATARALQLLNLYCEVGRSGRLPTLIEDWLRNERQRLNGDGFPHPRKPLVLTRPDRTLMISAAKGDHRALLLLEQAEAPVRENPLSPREWQILGLVEQGRTNVEIAAALWIAPGTVRRHLQNIYTKLGVHSRTAAIARTRDLNADSPPVE